MTLSYHPKHYVIELLRKDGRPYKKRRYLANPTGGYTLIKSDAHKYDHREYAISMSAFVASFVHGPCVVRCIRARALRGDA